MLYRPGSNDADDPEVAEALKQARCDAELAKWFEGHCALQSAIRNKLRQATAPDGLKQQILAEHNAHRKIVPWHKPTVLAAIAAAIVLLLGLTVVWSPSTEENGFSGFRSRMVSTALRNY